MNKDTIQGDWTVLKGRIKQQWGKLTDDDLEQVNGSRDVLTGKIQKAYGLTKEEAQKRMNEWKGWDAGRKN